MVEDIATEAELSLRELKRAGMGCESRRVETAAEFRKELLQFKPDIILSDFSMPQFDGMEALSIAAQEFPDIPFIFVSGNLGEEYAIRALNNGAMDYVLKTNLIRLPAAVGRALDQAQKRRERASLVRRLQENEAGLMRAQSLAKLAHIVTGLYGQFEKWSETLPRLLGVMPGDVPTNYRAWLDLLHPGDRDLFHRKILEAANSGAQVETEYRLRHAGGEWIFIRQVIETLNADRKEESGGQWFCTLQDITEQKVAEERIKRLNRVHAVQSGINALIVRTRDRDELFREACRIAVEKGGFTVGWISLLDRDNGKLLPVARAGLVSIPDENGSPDWLTPAGTAVVALREKRPAFDNAIDSSPDAAGTDDAKDTLSIRHAAIAMGARSVIVLPLFVEGEVFGLLSLYAPEPDFFDNEEVSLLAQLAADVSFGLEFISKQERVDFLAFFDPLTGLPNRSLFSERLSQQLMGHHGDPELVAVVFMDIERMRLVNDTMGRQAGDDLLRLVARRLESSARLSSPSRIGANIFGVVVRGAKDADDLAQLIEAEMKSCFGSPFSVGGQELRIDARAGISVCPDDGVTAETLLRNAEAALRSAKYATDRFRFFAPEMMARVGEILALESKLRTAVELNQFVLHYQPKFNTISGEMTGVEALIRWNDPELGMVPPLKFIHILEDTGLIVEVGRWALLQTLADQKRWGESGARVPRVAVNVSAQQLRDARFVADVQMALSSQEGSEAALELELTESLLMRDIEINIEVLNTLRGLGITIAIDDFGTGYSSLNYLARIPMDTLKIDRSFVVSMNQSVESRTIVSTIISLAHSLGLKVVAEGVETGEQRDLLKALACDELQGFLLGRPVPAEAIARRIAGR